jgi:hypothetical protein
MTAQREARTWFMRRRTVAVRTMACIALIICASTSNADAQVYLGREAPRRGSVEIGGGGAWGGGFDVTTLDAELTRAADNTGFDLFSTDGSVSGFPGAHARLGVYLSRAVSIEGGVRVTRPRLSFDLSGDAESAPDETATETLTQYVFDGSVLFHFIGASFAGGRGVPFASAGGGYVRELHANNELVETGDEVHATIGIKYWFGAGDRRVGLRGEAGLSSRRRGFDPEEGRRMVPMVLGGLTFLF